MKKKVEFQNEDMTIIVDAPKTTVIKNPSELKFLDNVFLKDGTEWLVHKVNKDGSAVLSMVAKKNLTADEITDFLKEKTTHIVRTK